MEFPLRADPVCSDRGARTLDGERDAGRVGFGRTEEHLIGGRTLLVDPCGHPQILRALPQERLRRTPAVRVRMTMRCCRAGTVSPMFGSGKRMRAAGWGRSARRARPGQEDGSR